VSERADQTVLTTGANSGLGLATALEVAKAGFRSVGSVRSPSKAKTVRQAAAQAGVTVDTVILDVTDRARCAAVIARLRPWGLVNNAGYGLTGAVEDVDDDEAQALIDTMVMAPMRLARLALPHMRNAKGGRIVNVSSIYGRVTTPLSGWYQGAKHALEALSDALRVEVASAGVKVVLVEPGGFKTNIWEDAQADVDKRAGSRYDTAYRRSLSGMKLTEPLMGGPAQVGKVISRALTTSRPRARYLVGLDAQAIVMAEQLTPTAIKDLVTRLSLGL
jgi:NAD(P)-dependent dehydrogenase (short-subunit alcohol dehydrogenase family)